MARLIKFIFCVVVLFLFMSCKKRQSLLDAHSYIEYCKQNADAFIKEKKIGDLIFKVKYEPADFLLARSIIEEGIEGNKSLIDQLKNKYGQQRYFRLDIVNAGAEADLLGVNISSQQEMESRVNYYSYEFENDIRFYNSKDTLKCALFHYENSYGGTPKLSFVFSFKPQSGEENQLIINDRIFNTGDIKFLYSKKELDQLPQLTY